MKNFFFFIIAIILSSCTGTNQVKEIIIENNITNPVVHRVEAEQLLNVDKIGVYDTLSVFINRGHNYESFADTVMYIKKNYPNLIICTHVIFGLPKKFTDDKNIELESREDMLQTIKDISSLEIDAVKFHQLDIVKGSYFESLYKEYNFPVLDEDFYIDIMCDAISLIRENIIIARLMGDSLGDTLIAPKWKKSKGEIISLINKNMKLKNIIQGSNFRV